MPINNNQRTGSFAAMTRLMVAGAACLVLVMPTQAQNGGANDWQKSFNSFVPGKTIVPRKQMPQEVVDQLALGREALRAGDYETARTNFEAAADSGSLAAQWFLGNIHRQGLGVKRNPARAFGHYQIVAQAYDPEEPHYMLRMIMIDSITRLADAYRTGNEPAGIEKSTRRALRLYQTAAAAGHAGAQFGLGRMYLNGEGVSKDESYAMRWLGTAAQKRFAPAAALLGDLYLQRGDTIRAYVWYKIAGETASGTLNAYVADRHGVLAGELDDEQRGRAGTMYQNWVARYPARSMPTAAGTQQ